MSSLHTPLCDVLGIEVPIIQAGMGRGMGSTTTAALVAAVSEAGGMGCLGATGWEPEEIRAEIRKVRALTNRPFAVDLLLPASLAEADVPREEVRRLVEREHPEHWRFVQSLYERFGVDRSIKHPQVWALSPTLMKQQAEVVLEERVPVLVSGLGDPAWIVPLAHEAGIKVMGLVGAPRHAERQVQAGVDMVIAQGTEAGGHTGTIATLALVPQVVDQVAPTPVIAAGGIADGRTVAAALALGAQAVWCGTAFLFALEANVIDPHREQITAAGARDVIPGRSYTGKTSRVVKNEITTAWAESGLDPLPMPLQTVMMDDFTYAAEHSGRPDLIQNPAGQITGMLSKHEPAATIMRRMADEAATVIGSLQSSVAAGEGGRG